MEQPSFVKLATLLTHYPMLLMPDLFTQIYSRLKEAVNNSARLPKERCLKLIGFCDVFFPMKWPASFNKSQIILEFIVIWEKIDYFEAKKHVNLIVADLEVTPISLQAIGLLFRKKLASILSCEKYC